MKNLQKFALLIVVIISSCNEQNQFILNETFDDNSLGWVEETTNYHDVKIDSGFCFLASLDTASTTYYSSIGSLDKSYLYSLPNSFKISTKIKLLENDLDDAHYGVFLYGASLKYSFTVYKSGKVEVTEYDYNSEIERNLITADSQFEIENEVVLNIEIENKNLYFSIDDYEFGETEVKVLGWQELRLFTSKQSKISIDYLTISPK